MATLVARMLVGKTSQMSAGYIPAPIAHTLIPTAWRTNRVQGWSVISRVKSGGSRLVAEVGDRALHEAWFVESDVAAVALGRLGLESDLERLVAIWERERAD